MHSLLLKAFLTTSWAAACLAQSNVQCVKGLYMIVARGTNETQGPGDMGRVANRILEKIPGSAIHPVVYPATFSDPYHVDSIKEGGIATRQAITEYAEKCPKGKIALLGYSQGAHVVGNSLCGDRTGWMNDTVAINIPYIQFLLYLSYGHTQFASGPAVNNSTVDNKLISVVLMGDPTYQNNLIFDKGTARSDGLWPRNWTACNTYASLSRSYCDTGDIFCDASSPSVEPTPHREYVHRYGVDAVEFVIRKWNEATTGPKAPVDGGEPFPLLTGSGGQTLAI